MRCSPTMLRGPICALAVLLGCDPSAPVVPDAGPWEPSIAAPAPPAPPRFVCPDRYHAVELDGAQVCEPWDGERPRCVAGELLRAGGCEPIADDCGTEAPPETSDPGVVLVRPGSTGGDGSLERPFGTITEALASGARTLALSPGEHAITGGVSGATLIGTCPTLTTIRVGGGVLVSGATTLRRLRVTGAGQLTVPAEGVLTLDRVELTGMIRAVELEGSLHAHRAAIHDISGEAIAAFAPISMVLEDVALERIASTAIFVDDAALRRAAVSLAGVVLVDVGAGTSLEAISIKGAATLNVERVVIEDAADHGLVARATTMTVADVVLRRLGGAALFLEQGSSEIDRVWIHETAAGVSLGPGEHHARDLVIADAAQIALLALDADGDATRVDVRRAGTAGVNIAGGSFTVRDLQVSDVIGHPDHDGTGGAFLVERGANATLERARLERSEHFGLAVVSSTLVASDVEVRDVRLRLSTGGYGVIAQDGSDISLTRASIHDVSTIGFSVRDSIADAEDLRIERVSAPDEVDGVGLLVVGASSAVLTRAAVIDTVRWGVLVSGLEASLVATGLELRGVLVSPCGELGLCPAAEGGAGLVVHESATAAVTTFQIRECGHAGFVATPGVLVGLTDGQITDNEIGMIVGRGIPVNRPSMRGLSLIRMQVRGNRVQHRQGDLDIVPLEIVF